MELPIYQVDAFASKSFKGNPAAVVPLKEWLPDQVLQNIAIENNLSETAFFIADGDNFYLRWFTPTYEIDLCGHATLAASFVILTELFPDRDEVKYKTNVAGELIVKKDNNSFTMNFPNRKGDPVNIEDIPEYVLEGIGNIRPSEAYKARDLMLVFDTEDTVKSIEPNFRLLIKYPKGIIVTAKSDSNDIDFISRFFCAHDETIPEDPVTGSAHCTLIPYWAEKLGKNNLTAYQASKRGGHLGCRLDGDRVYITGNATLYLKGTIYV